MIIEDRREFISFKDCGAGCVFDNGKGYIFIKIELTAEGINAIRLDDGSYHNFKGDDSVQPVNATLVIE